MNNPYNILNSLGLPDCTLSNIMSFNRPQHPVVEELYYNFLRCGKCLEPVKSNCGQISLRYFTIQNHCLVCNIDRYIVCKECPMDERCNCSESSMYSWFSF